MNRRLRQFVLTRARGFCEYCRLHQQFDVLPHHVDHIQARKHRGPTTQENLALACTNCSLAKGSNIAGLNRRTGELSRLFHPRTDVWSEHFRWNGPKIVGRTVIGRVTVELLNMNELNRVELRRMLIDQGCFPPELA